MLNQQKEGMEERNQEMEKALSEVQDENMKNALTE